VVNTYEFREAEDPSSFIFLKVLYYYSIFLHLFDVVC